MSQESRRRCGRGRTAGLSRREAANLVECSSQRMQRVVGAGFDRAGRHAESLGGLRYGGAAEVAFEQYLLVLGRQRTEGSQYELAVDDSLCGVIDRLLGNLVGDYFRVATVCPPFVDDDVAGHGEQPAALRAACLFEYASVAPGAEHGLLHDVLRFDSVTAVEADDIGPQGMGVLVVEGAKQVGVTPADHSHAHAARSPLVRGMLLVATRVSLALVQSPNLRTQPLDAGCRRSVDRAV